MLEQAILNKDNKEVKKAKLPEAIFGAKVSKQLLFDCVQGYLANKRQGTVKAKDRGEVHGTTAKMYKQKGTGRARHGSAKSNIFVGGGSAFPPRPRNWTQHQPKQMKKTAMTQALALRYQEGNLVLVDHCGVESIKTKKMAEQLRKWSIRQGLLVVEKTDEKTWKSVRNIPRIRVVTASDVNALDILSFEKIVVTEKALEALEKRLG